MMILKIARLRRLPHIALLVVAPTVMKRKTSGWGVITVTDGITIDVRVLQHYHHIYNILY